MIAKSTSAALTLLLALTAGPVLQAQERVYKRISSNEARTIAEGEWVKTRGHTWLSPQGVLLNFNLPSAMVPTRIDVTKVSPESVSRLKAECSAQRQFDGGCNAIVRGQVGMIGDEKGIIATDIQILPR